MIKNKRYIILMLSIAALYACKGKKEVKEEVLRPVTYQVVGNVDAQKVRTLSGVAKAGDEIELSFRTGGVISQVNVKVGQTVKKGALIARLDNVEANLAYEKSVSALSAATSAKNTSETELERIKGLYERQGVSLSDYQAAKDNYENALAQFESAKRNKSIQQTQQSYGYIYAPSDGLIAKTDGGLNETISGGHVFAVLNAGDQINIEVGLPENLINRVKVGMSTDISLSALDEKFQGNVIEVSPIVDPNSATYPVKIGITNPESAIKPGMAANVTFNFASNETEDNGALIIPLKAVGEDGNGNFVFLIESEDDKTGVAKKQTIEVGELTSEGFKVKSGLEEGQKIAVAGLQTLLDGQKVRLQQ